MRPMRKAAVVLAGLLAVAGTSGPASAGSDTEVVVDVTEFGADPTGRADSAPAVRAALDHAKEVDSPVRVLFPHGTYQLYPEAAETRELYISNTVGANQTYRDKRIGILVEDMSDVTVDGDGSRLQYHGLQTAFAAIRSSNVTFRDFSFDYTSPKVIDATVSEAGVEQGRAYRVLALPPDTNYSISGTSVSWLGERSPTTGTPYWSGTNAMVVTQAHDPAAQRTWRTSNPLFRNVAEVTDLGHDRIRVDYTTTARPTDEGLVYQMRDGVRDTSAALFWESRGITVTGLQAHFLHGFGMVGQLSRDVSIIGNELRADPATGRTTSAFADHIQMSGVAGRVVIRDNVFDGPHDDPINIHGTYLRIESRPAPDTVVLSYRHPETAGFPAFHPGDEVEVVDTMTMAPVVGGTAQVVAVDGPSGTDHDTSLTTMTVTLDRALPDSVTPQNFVMENTTYTPSVEVSGNTFRNVPTRGILVTTRKPVRIEHNLFDGMTMASVYISSDAFQWYESGPVADVLIRKNTFRRPGGPVIWLDPTNRVVDSQIPVHRNVRIESNTFEIDDVQLVDAKSVAGLTFSDNKIRRLDRDRAIEAWADDRCPAVGGTTRVEALPAASELTTPLYRLRGSSAVTISGNAYDRGLNRRIVLDGTPDTEVHVSDDGARVGADSIEPLVGSPTYASSDSTIANVAADGTVRAKRAGTVDVTATVATAVGPTRAAVTLRVGTDPASADCVQPLRLSPDWTVVRDDPTHRALRPDGGLDVVPSGSGFLWAGSNTARNLVMTSAGSGEGTATVRMSGRTQRGYMEAGLLLRAGDDDYVAIQRKHNNGTPTITVVSELGGSPEESRRVPDVAQDDVWLRLTRSGDSVTASYSLDGTTWTQLGTPVPATTLGRAQFGVMAAVENSGTQDRPFTFAPVRVNDGVVPFTR